VTDTAALEPRIVEALKTVYDPEIPVDIWELGLIYSIDIEDDGSVGVKMTLTAPACPAAGELPGEVERAVRSVPGVTAATVDLVWEPAWNKDMMSDVAKLKLGFY
jgi:FeS assembly SUF system protein